MKPKQKKINKSTLSDKIADALTVKPRADIEDDHVFGTKPKILSRADISASESEDETAISDFRKINVNLLSEINKKYEGKTVSRKELDKDSSLGSDSDDDYLDYGKAQQKENELKEELDNSSLEEENDKGTDQSNSDGESDAESEDYSILSKSKLDDSNVDSDDEVGSEDDEEDDNEEAGYDMSQMDEPVKEDFRHLTKQNVSEEVKKGNSIRNQLLLWEGLLEMRIHLQRCMVTANQMPMHDTYNEMRQSNEFIEEANTTKTNISNMLDKMLTLQNMLLKKFPETKSLSGKIAKEPSSKPSEDDDDNEEIPSDTEDEEIPSDTEDEANNKIDEPTKSSEHKQLNTKKRKLEDYEKEISVSHKAFKSFRDATIKKWNEKTRLATATNIKNAPINTVLQQISYILSDRNKLIQRTQLKRSEYDIVGYKRKSPEDGNEHNDPGDNPTLRSRKDVDEYIPEIFDDSDFYHQLLRELIECKSADISDPVQLSRQWIALQQMRSKMKRKVDTKATKGRKIKYVVHNQLVNFMAPEKSVAWTEESVNELYSSLFGKLFEYNNTGLNVQLENGTKIK